MGLKWLPFSPTSSLLVDMKRDGWQIQIKGHSHFPHKFWSSYEYFIRTQSEDYCCYDLLIQSWPHQFMLITRSRMIVEEVRAKCVVGPMCHQVIGSC